MPRARFIRPEFFIDEKVGELSHSARLLWISIWVNSDMQGVFEWEAGPMRIRAFPYDVGITKVKIEEWLSDLEKHGMIVRFEADGKSWGFVKNWQKYQSFTTSERATPIRWPAPPGQPDGCHKSDGSQTQVRPESEGSRPLQSPISNLQTLKNSTSPPGSDVSPREAKNAKKHDGDGDAKSKISGFDRIAVRNAVESDDLAGVIRGFGGNLGGDRMSEWTRDCAGMCVQDVAIVMWESAVVVPGEPLPKPIREPSGFRKSLVRILEYSADDRAQIRRCFERDVMGSAGAA